jgi:signal transduction histidine kinase/ligand-binding sensor domain-containing protein
MGKPHGQGRYAPLRLAIVGLRTVQLSILLAGVLLAWCPGAYALNPALDVSQYAHTSWKVRDGFTKGAIGSIAQTPDGYLWLGTEFGLVRFDGVRAVPWQPPAGQQLPSTFIRSLLASRDGTLWIGTLKGLASWRGGKLIQYPTPADQSIDTLLEDDEGTIWFGTQGIPTGRLCAIRGGDIQCYGEDGSFGRWIEYLFEDGQKTVWAASATGLWKWKPGPPKRYSMPSPIQSTRQTLVEASPGTLLVSTAAGMSRFADEKTDTYLLPNVGRKLKPNKLFLDRNGGLWVAATDPGGLAHVHDGKTDFFSLADGLSGDNTIVLFEDREGDIWVGTEGGLDRFRDYAVTTFSRKQGVSDASVWSVLAAGDENVWIGTVKGLDRWSDSRINAYDKRDGKLNGLVPHCLFEDSRGQIWVSTSAGFGHLENTRFIPVNGAPGGIVRGIAEDTEGNLWIANQSDGLIRLRDGNVAQQIPWTTLGHKDFATAIAADPLNGGLWLGFYNGGVVHFSAGQVRAAYTAADGLGKGFVGRFRFDADGTVWAATQGGLSRVKNGHVTTLTSKNGLPCDAVNWVIRDNDGSFWLNTACGLVRINRSELDGWAAAADKDKDTKQAIQASVFDTSDGVRSAGIGMGFSPAVTRSSDGKLWFTSLDGVSVVDPRHLPFNKLPPPVQIEQITADRKTYDAALDGTGNGNGRLRLPPLVRDLAIDYTALSLVAPEKVRFRYKLEGRDGDWQDAGNRRQAFYTDLPPHNYRFRVVACNNSGVWNEVGTFLDFSVAPAYYQTTWFRLSCVAAFLALLWGLYQLRLQQLAREFNAGLEARVNERTRIARDLHDTLLQSFHGLLLRFQAVSNLLPTRPAEAKQTLDSAIDQAAQAITEGRDAVQGLRSSTVVTNDLACAITTLGQELAGSETNPNAAEFHVEMEGTTRDLHPILRDEVYRIAGESVRNAFKHAQARRIEVEIRYDERQFRLRVRDDGKGIDPKLMNEDGRTGHYGLRGMRERAKLLGGKLAVWSELDSGTELELRIPASRAYETSPARRRSWLAEKLSGKDTETKS